MDNIADMNALVQKQGIFLGWTDNTGYVMPKPRFNQAGQYWLIAIKDVYVPGIDTITVTGPVAAKPVPLAKSAKTSATK